MLILALDTATDQGSLALLEGDRVLVESALSAPGAFLVHLLPRVEALFEDAGRDLKELSLLAVSQGPGNFTGLRLGLATAKGLALALDLPLVPVSTLAVLAAGFPGEPQPVAALVDAKRQEIYLELFDTSRGRPEPLGEPVRLAAATLPERLKPPLLLTGPGLTAYEEFLRERLPPEVRFAPPASRRPRASVLARLALTLWREGFSVPPQELVPTYLRPAL